MPPTQHAHAPPARCPAHAVPLCPCAGTGLRIFAALDPLDAQEQIDTLKRRPVQRVSLEDDDEEEDDRPLWQRRLDEENAREGFDRFGPPAVSGIP